MGQSGHERIRFQCFLRRCEHGSGNMASQRRGWKFGSLRTGSVQEQPGIPCARDESPRAAVTKKHRLRGCKHHKRITSQVWRSEV